MASHEPGIESDRACLGLFRRRVQAFEPHVQNLRQLETALHRHWR